MGRYLYWAALVLIGLSMVLPFGTVYVDFGPSQPNGAPSGVFRGWDFLLATLFGNWLGMLGAFGGHLSFLPFFNLVPLGTLIALLAASRGISLKRTTIWVTALIALCLATSFINAASLSLVVHPWEVGAWLWRLGIVLLLVARFMSTRSSPREDSTST